MIRAEQEPPSRAPDAVGATSTAWLRPLGVGERVDAGIKLYLRGFRTFAPALLVVGVPIALLLGAFGWWRADAFPAAGRPLVTKDVFGDTTFHSNVLRDQLLTGALALLAGLVVNAVPKAIAFTHFGESYLGRPGSWTAALLGGLRRVGSVVWVLVLLNGAILVAMAAAAALVLAVVGPLGPGSVVLVVPSAVLALVFVAWWDIAVRLTIPALVMEGLRGSAAVRRSLSLVRGAWWPAFGTILLASLLAGILTLVANLLLGVLTSIAVPSSHAGAHAFVATTLEQLVSIVAVVPFACAIATVVSVDLRVRKEGLDLELLTGATDGATPRPGSSPRPGAVLAPGTPPSPWPPPTPPTPPPPDGAPPGS